MLKAPLNSSQPASLLWLSECLVFSASISLRSLTAFLLLFEQYPTHGAAHPDHWYLDCFVETCDKRFLSFFSYDSLKMNCIPCDRTMQHWDADCVRLEHIVLYCSNLPKYVNARACDTAHLCFLLIFALLYWSKFSPHWYIAIRQLIIYGKSL